MGFYQHIVAHFVSIGYHNECQHVVVNISTDNITSDIIVGIYIWWTILVLLVIKTSLMSFCMIFSSTFCEEGMLLREKMWEVVFIRVGAANRENMVYHMSGCVHTIIN